MKDSKMSKSKGNVIYPEPLITNYGRDTLRYYLLREVPFGKDGEFTPENYISRINNDLANDLGNLVNRTVSMANQYFAGEVTYRKFLSNENDELASLILITKEKVSNHLEQCHFSKALEDI